MGRKPLPKTKVIGTEEIKKKYALVKEDIVQQLENLSKFGKFYEDLIEEYMYLIELREELKQDIHDKGVRYKFKNGNGKNQEKANESVGNIIKIEQIMLKVINDLGINQPLLPPTPKEKNIFEPQDNEDEQDLL